MVILSAILLIAALFSSTSVWSQLEGKHAASVTSILHNDNIFEKLYNDVQRKEKKIHCENVTLGRANNEINQVTQDVIFTEIFLIRTTNTYDPYLHLNRANSTEAPVWTASNVNNDQVEDLLINSGQILSKLQVFDISENLISPIKPSILYH